MAEHDDISLEEACRRRAARREEIAKANHQEVRIDEPGSATISIRCECGSCREWLYVDVAAYSGARRMKRFITVRGHYLPGFDRVVTEAGEYYVVELVE